jgi:hypothetical protein
MKFYKILVKPVVNYGSELRIGGDRRRNMCDRKENISDPSVDVRG